MQILPPKIIPTSIQTPAVQKVCFFIFKVLPVFFYIYIYKEKSITAREFFTAAFKVMSSRVRILTSSSGKAVKTDKVDVSARAPCLEDLHCGALCWLRFIFQIEHLFWTASKMRENELGWLDVYMITAHHECVQNWINCSADVYKPFQICVCSRRC